MRLPSSVHFIFIRGATCLNNILERPQVKLARASQAGTEILNSSIEINIQDGKEPSSAHVSTKEINADSTRTISNEKPQIDLTNHSNEADLVSQHQNTVSEYQDTSLPEISSPHKNKINDDLDEINSEFRLI